MWKKWLSGMSAAALLAGGMTAAAPVSAEETADLVPIKAWYTAPAADWETQATPLGNGFLGAMVFGGVASDRIQINEHTLWSGGPGANPNYNGGHKGSAEKVREALQTLRKLLQDEATAFSKEHEAYIDKETGALVTADYLFTNCWGDLSGGTPIDQIKIPSTGDEKKDAELRDELKQIKALLDQVMGDKGNFGSYQSMGNLMLEGSDAAYTDYTRSLDLRRAVTTVSYKQADVTYTREYFISNPGNVMVVRLSAGEKGKITEKIFFQTEQTKKTITAEGDTITIVGQPADQRAEGLHFAGQIRVLPTGGSMAAADGAIQVTGADEVLLVFSAGTNYVQCMDDSYDYFGEEDPLTAVEARVDAAASKGYDALLAAHEADYGELFSRVELSLGAGEMPAKPTDELLKGYNGRGNTDGENRYLEELYYQFGRYLLIASSREGSLPANLQGIWADGLNPPWNADYHTNINLQMNYWLAEQTNLAECHTPAIEYVNSLVPRGEETAKWYYCTQDGGDVRGWVIHHENNIWGNTAPGNWYNGFYFPAAAAWMCQDIWEYYAFNQDEEFLAENYDTMLEAALFWVDNLWEDERDGKLVANPSFSPEHGAYTLGASCDQTVIWELFEEVIKASEVLGKTSAELEEIKTAQSKLSLPEIGLGGQYMEWKDEVTIDTTGDAGHRHVNHLYALHPGTLVVAGRSEEDDAYIEAMKKTLTTRGDGGTGWSKAWKINFWARLRDGDHAGVMVNQILRESTTQNLFDTHPPFQIDGNFGATAGMTEMLLQSQGNSIDLLPALPYMWGNGSVTGLKARGNFEVDMAWEDRMLQSVSVTSIAGGDCTLNHRSLSEAKVTRKSDGKVMAFTKVDEDTITFATEKGETYVVTGIPQIIDIGRMGDMNYDGKVNTTDARMALQFAVEKLEITEDQWIVGDVNRDEVLNTTDARLILQYAVGKIDRFD